MRNLQAILFVAFMLSIESCTPSQVQLRYSCDGSFKIEEETPDAIGTVTVTPKHNIAPGATGDAMPTDTVDDRGIITVRGKVLDVCDDAWITYTGPGQWGRFTTVNIPRSTLKATAPPTAYAAQDGKFTYSIAVECCPLTSGRIHEVKVRASKTVLYARVGRTTVTCVDNNPIVVDGKMAGNNTGYVTVTIINDEGRTCEYETVIAREF